MNPIELQNAFEMEMNRRDSNLTLSTDKVFYFINEAAEDIVKDRAVDMEDTQASLEDLRTLIDYVEITPIADTTKPNSYIADLTNATRYFYTLDEEVDITYDTTTKRQGITEVTSDTYRTNLDDPYSEHNLKYGEAKPLRLNGSNNVLLISDGNYTVDAYYLRYLKLPNKVDLDAYVALPTDGLLDLPDHMHGDVIKVAVRMAIENQTDVRYQSYINEVNNIE